MNIDLIRLLVTIQTSHQTLKPEERHITTLLEKFMLNKANTFDETRVVITNSLRLHTNHVICPSCFDINLDCIFRVNYRNLNRHEGSADLLKGK